ncbi:MAG: hypothetical protein ABIJ12_10525 [bacterium]
MDKFLLISFTSLLIIIACNKEKPTQNTSEFFAGELVFKRVDEVFERTDFVNLSITGSSYDLNHVVNESNLCNSYGSQNGFGTNKLILSPDTTFHGTNCDNTRIPRGEFVAVFRGDSLILGPKVVTLYIDLGENNTRQEIWSYHFKLVEE